MTLGCDDRAGLVNQLSLSGPSSGLPVIEDKQEVIIVKAGLSLYFCILPSKHPVSNHSLNLV